MCSDESAMTILEELDRGYGDELDVVNIVVGAVITSQYLLRLVGSRSQVLSAVVSLAQAFPWNTHTMDPHQFGFLQRNQYYAPGD